MSFSLNKADIDAILGQKNLLIRNLQITLGYHRVAKGLQRLISDRDVNWFGFGTYASKTAGKALRHEELPHAIKSAMIRAAGYNNTIGYLHDVLEAPDELNEQHTDNLLSKVLMDVSLLLSKGNLMIFSELAWPFVDMINIFSKDWKPDESKWNDFLNKHCVPGSVEIGGQELVRESMTCFYHARFETDKKIKAELILLGNLLIGLHEQTRLQPVIEKALATPFDVFTGGLHDEHDHESIWQKLSQKALGYSRKTILHTVTRMLMSYTLPTRELKLGKDLVAPTGLIKFPKELLKIENPRCNEIIRTFGTGMDTLSGSAAHNWGSLKDRMNFLVDFFRSYQHYEQLLQQPFSDEQIEIIDLGRYPSGDL